MDSIRYITFFLLAVTPGCLLQGYIAEQPTPLQRTAEAVRQAEANMTDNAVIVLPALKEDTLNGVRPPPYVVRAPLLGMATFICSTAAARQIVWHHQNASIHGDVLPPTGKDYSFYRQATSENHSYLHIHRVSRDSGGAVECWLPCGPTQALCHVWTYNFLPELRAQDVFLAPLRNVSTPLPKFSMTCSGRVDCSETGWEAHFIWKYDGRFVAAPYHDLRTIAGHSHTPGLLHSTIDANVSAKLARHTFCASTLTITLSETPSPPSVRVDCWLRPDLHNHRWFVQSAHVHFTSWRQ
ncbi:uncharacterized protein LOC129598184 isoform X2 [Paramacrobiotus metropolitanus]|uniref:uncharacterized protein LOC129598184 isoform X2 n=1 Tax=Paramacrobiotus metropolitanus TaxID=2943436 RepID=UPI00244616A9|nr:uncharacterized protein LOC129598184 isoform X2 [Paramacrobiotus metropolitanus]